MLNMTDTIPLILVLLSARQHPVINTTMQFVDDLEDNDNA